mgnify:CR=1 FL=1
MREKYQEEIEKRVNEFENGYAFTAVDFLDIADTDAVNKALSRMSDDSKIRRIIKGVYDKPIFSTLLQENSTPNIDSISSALARKFNWTIAPAGETALNYLHMSTQVSNRWCYISDGPYRDYQVGPYTIEFRHCANREISGRCYMTIVAIQAIKAIGRTNISKQDISHLKTALAGVEKEKIIEESRSSTSWVHKIIREACS